MVVLSTIPYLCIARLFVRWHLLLKPLDRLLFFLSEALELTTMSDRGLGPVGHHGGDPILKGSAGICGGRDMREEGEGGCFSFWQRSLHVPPATKHKESCSFVSTKELDEKIEGTYLTELSLQADDVPTNAQSTRRLVLKH